MGRIKGITVVLYQDTAVGLDGFNTPVYSEQPVAVDNVLVAPVSAEDIVNDTALYGKRTVYQLGIPKGDTHDWKEKRVDIFGEKFQTVGEVVKGIEDMIPLDWNGKIKVVRYE